MSKRLRSGHWVVIGFAIAGILAGMGILWLERSTLPTRETYWAVKADLGTIAASGLRFLEEHPERSSVSVGELIPDYLDASTGLPLDRYRELSVSREGGELRIRLDNNVEVYHRYP